jgi:hypothetical protein
VRTPMGNGARPGEQVAGGPLLVGARAVLAMRSWARTAAWGENCGRTARIIPA